MVGYLLAWTFFICQKRFDPRVVMVAGVWIQVVGCLLIGPIFPVDRSVVWTCIGMFTMGAGSALAYLPTLPYMIKSADKKFDDVRKEDLSDALSAIFGTCHYIGETVGPLYSGIMTEAIGFRYAAAIFGAIIFCYSLFFGWYSEFWAVLCSCCSKNNELNEPLVVNDPNPGAAAGTSEDTAEGAVPASDAAN